MTINTDTTENVVSWIWQARFFKALADFIIADLKVQLRYTTNAL